MEALTVDYDSFGSFFVNNGSDIIAWRAKKFLTKEPTTLEWLQSLEPDSILVDIGANIGIYSIPAALFHVKKVYAVEPELKNFTELVNNIELNNLDESRIEAIPIAISSEFAETITQIYLTSDQPGMSCHQVGRNQDFKLSPIKKKRKHRSVYCVSLADFIQNLPINDSDKLHLKIDVDGIETDVCESLFKNNYIHRISSLQIELNPEIETHKDLINRLHSYGFSFLHSQVRRAVRKSGSFKGFAEYVFRRRIPSKIFNLLPEHTKQSLSTVNRTTENDISSDFYVDPSIQEAKIPDITAKHGSQITKISDNPPCFTINNGLKLSQKRQISNLIVSSIDKTENFTFKSQSADYVVNDQQRLKVSLNEIFIYSPNYKKYLQSLVADLNMLKNLTKAIVPTLQEQNFADSTRPFLDKNHTIIARARHFVDLRGFYLARHNDSSDTFLAYICPLESFATTTSLFTKKPSAGCFRDKNDVSSLNFNYESQFTPNTKISFISEGELGMAVESNNSTLRAYSVTSINSRLDESIIIPNVNFEGLNREKKNSSSARKALKGMGHGVFPPIQETLRPILLIDYCLWPEELEIGKIYTGGDSSELIGALCSLSDLNQFL